MQSAPKILNVFACLGIFAIAILKALFIERLGILLGECAKSSSPELTALYGDICKKNRS